MIFFSPLDLIFAWLLDFAIGDPAYMARIHPIVLIGRLISWLESHLLEEGGERSLNRQNGVFLFFIVMAAVLAGAFLFLWVAGLISAFTGHLASIALAWSCIATRDLDRQVRGVVELAERGEVVPAREAISLIVGRDTEDMEADEIYRAAFETTAENSSDGIVAPIIYLGIGGFLGLGPLLGLLYKAVNTLDSMVGYKNEKYLDFGAYSARADDLFNWVPARLTVFLVAVAATISGGSFERALKIAKRDGKKHASPNSGFPEAAYAGALGVKLGGVNRYGGVDRVSPEIGGTRKVTPEAVREALKISWIVSLGCLILGAAVVALA